MREIMRQETIQTVADKGNAVGGSVRFEYTKPSLLCRIRNFFAKLFATLGVLVLLCVIVPSFIHRTSLSVPVFQKPTEKLTPTPFPKEKVDKEVYNSMIAAYDKAETYASDKLDQWIVDVMYKADADFLPWYFNYINMKTREIKGLGYDIVHWFNNMAPSSAEILLQDLDQALNSRLLQAQITQLTFENILSETVRVYNKSLTDSLAKIQVKYSVPEPEWKDYLSDLSHVVQDSGTSMTPVPIKVVIATTGVATLIIGNTGIKCITAIGKGVGKLFAKTTGKTVAKAGGKAASKMLGKTLGKFAGSIITVAILVWDIVDYKMTEARDKPILRQNIQDYLVNVKLDLLYDEEFGICSELNSIQEKLAQKL